MDFDISSIPPEHRAELLRRMPAFEVVPSPLVRVVGVGQLQRLAGVTVELLALEVRERGAILHWRASSDRELAHGEPVVEVSDDAQTGYDVGPLSFGGGGTRWEGQTALRPAPPLRATLTFTIRRFEPMPMPGYTPPAPTEGPWRFDLSAGE